MIGNRFKQVRTTLHLTQVDLATHIGISTSSLSQIENGRINPTIEIIQKVSQHYQIDLNWLLLGKGSMHKQPDSYQRLDELQQILGKQLEQIEQVKQELESNEYIDIPVQGEIAAGEPIENRGMGIDVISVKRAYIHGNVNNFIGLRVNGSSMEPEIKHEDVVLIKENDNWQSCLNKICAIRIDGSITLKKLMLDTKQKLLILMSLNPSFSPMMIDPGEHSDVALIGEMAFLYRKFSH